MPTNFPTALDTFPSAVALAANTLNTDPHSTLHGNLGDALAALEAKVGIDGSSVPSSLDYLLSLKAALASPTFTGTPSAPTPPLADSSTRLATTAYVQGQGYLTSVPPAPVTTVSNADGTLTISPTTGAVVASLALSHANTWTGQQTFDISAPLFSTMTVGSVLFAGASGLLSQDNSLFFYDPTNHRLGLKTAAPTHDLTIGYNASGYAQPTGLALYGTTDQTTNYARGRIFTDPDGLKIFTDKAGIATQMSIYLLAGSDTGVGNANRTGLVIDNSSGGVYWYSSASTNFSMHFQIDQTITWFPDVRTNPNNVPAAMRIQNFGTMVQTSGNINFLQTLGDFRPTSGSASFAELALEPTINQTGGASGIARGLYVNPTLIAVADFRAIETAVGNVLIKTGAATTKGLLIQGASSQSAPLVQLYGQSSLQAREQADLDTAWVDSTDATRKARVLLRAWDTAAREGLRIEADGTNPLIGFLGAGAVSRPTVTGSRGGNAALASLLAALTSLGLVTDSTTA